MGVCGSIAILLSCQRFYGSNLAIRLAIAAFYVIINTLNLCACAGTRVSWTSCRLFLLHRASFYLKTCEAGDRGRCFCSSSRPERRPRFCGKVGRSLAGQTLS